MSLVLAAPASETRRQREIAGRSLGWRLARFGAATVVMLGVVLAAGYVRRNVLVPGASEGRASLVAGIAVQSFILAAVLVLAIAMVGLGNVRLRWRGGSTSLVLMLPLFAISVMDARIDALPGAAEIVAVMVFATIIALAEEVYGRGLLVTLLGGRRHALVAVSGSAVGFAYLHLPSYAAIHGWHEAWLRSTASAAFSAIGAIVVLRSGSLLGPLVFHAINDAQAILGSLAVATHTAPLASASSPTSTRPIIVGLVLAGIYWLGCRRGIAAGLDAPAEPEDRFEAERGS